MECKIQKVLEMLASEGTLGTFDVREYELGRLLDDTEISKRNLKGDARERLEQDRENYARCDNLILKTAIGKKWAKTFGYDYDASLFSSIIYRMTVLSSGVIVPLSASDEYKINSGGEAYRGDTMNSWQTTLDEFIRIWGRDGSRQNGGYIKDRRLVLNTGRGPNHGKWRILQDDPASDWVGLLSDPDSYNQEQPFPSCVTEFLKVVYTIGNFIPIPLRGDFNGKRAKANFAEDYWDLTLLAVYRYYTGGDNSEDWTELFQEASVRRWLSGYGDGQVGWNRFVERNFLQDFVNQEGNGYGQPKELWRGHFSGGGKPKEKEQFIAFFTNASVWIQARGVRIAIAVKKTLEGQKLRELAQEMAGNRSKEDQ